MRPIISKPYLIILLAFTIITACKKEESPVAKEAGFGNMSYIAKAAGSGLRKTQTSTTTATNSAGVKWSAASVYVEKIAFVGKGYNLLDTTILVQKNINIFKADALAGIIQLPQGSYKDVKVKLFARKSDKSELAFNFKGTFTNTKGGTDSIRVGSSFPFEANLEVPDITINPSDKYKVIFTFNLDRVLDGISTESLQQTARNYPGANNSKMYVIWKGGSADEPFYDQVIKNWQTVASVAILKQ